MKYRILFFILVFAGFWSCKPELNEFVASKGSADFSVYVASGNSLTAGYTDGALYQSAQENSYAAILAKQLEKVGRQGTFNIPFISSEDGVGTRGSTLVTKMKMGFSTDCLGVTSLAPVLSNPSASQQELFQLLGTPVAANGPFHNVGVPGAKVGHLLAPGYGQLNPFFGRFASSSTASVIEEALATQPTFFTLWIGNNDVLGYATSGGIGDVITPVEGSPGLGFAASYEALIQSFKTTATAGAVANIPDIVSAPFFTTVPYNPIVLTDTMQVNALNAAYAQYNGGMESIGKPYRISFALGQNPMVIEDPGMDIPEGMPLPKIRQMKSTELALLTIPQDALKCQQMGSVVPVPNQYILTESEIAAVNQATEAYNQIIAAAAETHNLAFVDANAYMKMAANGGIKMDGVTFTNAFVTGNIFSTDGVHLSPQGNALVANYFIDAINSKYSASIPKVNVSEYRAVILP